MATDEHVPKVPSTDHEDTVVFENSSALQAGTLLKDRYLLGRLLSQGGFGAVYLAHDQQMHGRPVVVKIQIDKKMDDPWFERKFNEEVRALSMIDHPGVVVAIDSGRTNDGKLFLVMQYVDGITLRAVMSPEGIPLDRAAKILQQVGHALGAAHEKGVWHRDLKPENLMLEPTASSGERVRLIDFGIATVADLADKFQTNTRVAGSDPYMAPEQRFGQPTALTDIYAMGLIAYEMVTGRKPFMAENAVQLVALQRAGVRVKPSDLRPALSIAADRWILQSLEYEPAKRPQDAREFGDRLHDALMGSDVTRITSSPDARPGGSRKKWVIGSVAAALAVVLAGVYYESRSEPRPVAKQAPAAKSEGPVKDAAAEQAVEMEFWNSVKDSTEPQLYREYLAAYPQGRFTSLARAKLDILARKEPPKPQATPTAAPANANDEAQEQAVELAFWNSVRYSTEPQLYRDYLEKYPHGQFESVARAKLDILTKRAERKTARAQHQVSIPDMPDLGDLGIPGVKMPPDFTDFVKLKDTEDPQAYRDYLAKYPNGKFAVVARLKLAAIERKLAHDAESRND